VRWRTLLFLLFIFAASGGSFAQQSGTALLQKMGYPPDAKLLILHADDIGMSHSVNLASFEALEKGWVSSGSIMVPCPWFNEVVQFAKAHPTIDLGLHLTLTSEWENYRWGPVGHVDVSTLVDAQGYFPGESTDVGRRASASQAEREIRAQVDKARSAGIHFTHLDNHMGGLAQNAELFGVYLRAGRAAQVPVFISGGEIKAYPQIFRGNEFFPALTYVEPASAENRIEGFRKTFASLSPGVYITIVHLGHDDAELGAIMPDRDQGAASRQSDFDLVKDPVFRRALQENGIKLVGWGEVARALKIPASSSSTVAH
jgi:predicted glycoside hydrolase/deacetylase ChbG (UPF0249 family)